MSAQKDLESKMDELLVKKAPFQIPKNGREALVKYFPIIALVFGVLSLIAALGLWRTAHSVSDFADSVNDLARSYGVDTGYSVIDYGIVFYVAMLALVVQGVLLLAAYQPLKSKKKRGWDLLLYGTLFNLVYGVVYLFSDTGTFSNLIGSLIGAVISLYLLAQIRSHYTKTKTEA